MRTSEVIRAFLDGCKTGIPQWHIPPHADPVLLDRWTPDMEVQVMGDRNGEAIVREYRGHRYTVYTDGLTEWKDIRIPHGAMTDNPTFEDRHCNANVTHWYEIGITGWNWKARRSDWCGFDFDILIDHANGLSAAEIDQVRAAVSAVPWVEVRRSTRGNGLHLWVQTSIAARTHTEHQRVAKAVLQTLSREVGFDLAKNVDKCGGNMWIWSRRATPANQGFQLLKAIAC